MLELRHVDLNYGGPPVLVDFSLTLKPGQRIALMGPSGLGKTTVLRLALGLLKPAMGSAENTFSQTAAVFQEPRLLPWQTALENVNLVLGDTPKTLERAKKWLEAVELADALDKYPSELSGGMQQRTALARALAVEADLQVLDEPFKALDEALREKIMALVAKTNAAILLVTHDEAEAKALGCQIIRM